jgi:hypothetical protein
LARPILSWVRRRSRMSDGSDGRVGVGFLAAADSMFLTGVTA